MQDRMQERQKSVEQLELEREFASIAFSRNPSTITIPPTIYFSPYGESEPGTPKEQESSRPPLFSLHSQRLRIALLLMLGVYAVVSMRLNLSMAVVCMVNATAFSQPDYSLSDYSTISPIIDQPAEPAKCVRSSEQLAREGYDGTFLWSPHMQSLLFSATFYGSLATITISGTIADRIGPKICLASAAIVYIVVTLFTPLVSSYSFIAFFITRIIMGLAEGFVFPSIGSMAGRWFPQNERSTLAAIYTSGNQLAASLSSIISSSLCASSLGWPSIFYLFGCVGIVWMVLWFVFATNQPDKNRFISEEEKLFLSNIINRKKKPGPLPWRAMICSPPVLAGLLANFSYNFTATLMQAFLPTYFRDELLLPLNQNGLYTMIPFVTQLLSKNIVGPSADRIKSKGILSHTACAIVFQTISNTGCACSMFAMAIFSSCERPWLSGIFLAFYGVFFSFGIAGFFTSLLSVAPQFSGTMVSLSMTSATIANVISPLCLSMVMLWKTPYTWNIMFFLSAAINIIAGIVFFCFGSADVQLWALPKSKPSIDNQGNPSYDNGIEKPRAGSANRIYPLQQAISALEMDFNPAVERGSVAKAAAREEARRMRIIHPVDHEVSEKEREEEEKQEDEKKENTVAEAKNERESSQPKFALDII